MNDAAKVTNAVSQGSYLGMTANEVARAAGLSYVATRKALAAAGVPTKTLNVRETGLNSRTYQVRVYTRS